MPSMLVPLFRVKDPYGGLTVYYRGRLISYLMAGEWYPAFPVSSGRGDNVDPKCGNDTSARSRCVVDSVDAEGVLDYDEAVMSNDDFDAAYDSDAEGESPVRPVAMPRIPEETVPPITNRFLFVDVASLSGPSSSGEVRSRGSSPFDRTPSTGERPPVTSRLEKVAMDEVDEGLVDYEAPDLSAVEAKS